MRTLLAAALLSAGLAHASTTYDFRIDLDWPDPSLPSFGRVVLASDAPSSGSWVATGADLLDLAFFTNDTYPEGYYNLATQSVPGTPVLPPDAVRFVDGQLAGFTYFRRLTGGIEGDRGDIWFTAFDLAATRYNMRGYGQSWFLVPLGKKVTQDVPSPVPEPSTYVLMAAGLIALGAARYSRR